MAITGTEARYQLIATSSPSQVHVSGSAAIGTALSTVVYTDAPTVAYSLAMLIASGDTLTIDFATGAVTGTVAGAFQVETATIVAASGATTAGNLTVTVTSPLVTGSPLAISVPLTLAENTASLVAAQVRTVLAATAAVTAHYTVGGSAATYVLTALVKAPNDATLNLAHINDTSAGITTAATSANTTAGIGQTIAYKVEGTAWNATDYEGIALPAMTKLHSVLLKSDSASASVVVDDTVNLSTYASPFVSLISSPAGAHFSAADSVTFAATGKILLFLDIHAG